MDFLEKIEKRACFLSRDVLKYITVRRTSDRQISTKTDEKVRSSTSSSKKFKNFCKKCLTFKTKSGKMFKLSAAEVERQDLEN